MCHVGGGSAMLDQHCQTTDRRRTLATDQAPDAYVSPSPVGLWLTPSGQADRPRLLVTVCSRRIRPLACPSSRPPPLTPSLIFHFPISRMYRACTPARPICRRAVSYGQPAIGVPLLGLVVVGRTGGSTGGGRPASHRPAQREGGGDADGRSRAGSRYTLLTKRNSAIQRAS